MKTWKLKRESEILTIGLRKIDYINHFPYGFTSYSEEGRKERMFVIEYTFHNHHVGYSDDRPTYKEACEAISDFINEHIRLGYSLVI